MCKKELYFMSAAIVSLVFLAMLFPMMGTAADQSFVPTPPILNNIPPDWSQTLQCDATACPRFELVMQGQAVLDHETGLVWQRKPGDNQFTWVAAINECTYAGVPAADFPGEIGLTRYGWHLPTMEQLLTIQYRRPGGVAPKLPEGNPFLNVSIDTPYWTSTTYPGAPGVAWQLSFGPGAFRTRLTGADKTESRLIWCVRGGQVLNHDQYGGY